MMRVEDRVEIVSYPLVIDHLINLISNDISSEGISVEPSVKLSDLIATDARGINAALLDLRDFAVRYGVPAEIIESDYKNGKIRGISVGEFAKYIYTESRGLAA